jgi:hypothetical protein
MPSLPSTILAASGIMPVQPDENMAVSLALAGLAFLLTLLVGRPIVTLLRLKKMGKASASTGRTLTSRRPAPRPWAAP